MYDVEDYRRKYALKHNISEAEADKHLMVRIVKAIVRENSTHSNEGGEKTYE